MARAALGADWRIEACNAPLALLLGADAPEALVGRSLSEFVAERIVLDRLLASVRATGKAAGCEIDLKRLAGDSLPVVIVLDGEFDAGGSATVLEALIVEVADTGRRNVLGAMRMEAVGRLAGGIAHDFNNLLMIIAGHTERLLDVSRGEGPWHGSALAIQQASERAASLTRQLLAFSRRQTLQARTTELHTLIAGAGARLRALLPHNVTLALEIGDTPPVNVDSVRLEDALASLLSNACSAMPEGGMVTIRTGVTIVEDDARRPRPWIRPGPYAFVSVADTGHGMDEETRLRIFEPFFTTRSVRGGSGLGLATVYGFVKQSHGYIFVDSEPGRGAAFTILFPLVKRRAQTDGDDRGMLETILLVSDDERFRTELGDALRLEGYHVLDAPSGDRAAQVFAACTDRVHLLLVDAQGEAEHGRALVHRLKAFDPLLQALYLVAPANGARPLRLPGGAAVLPKPSTIEALVARLRDALDTGEGR
jgi:signal transduction histidine kinase